jgi:hypothetical protein
MEFRVARNVTTDGKTEEVAESFQYKLGTSVEEIVKLHGETAVLSCFLVGARVDVEKEARRVMQGGRNGAHRLAGPALQDWMSRYKLGTDMAARQRAARALSALPEEARAVALKALQMTQEEMDFLLS